MGFMRRLTYTWMLVLIAPFAQALAGEPEVTSSPAQSATTPSETGAPPAGSPAVANANDEAAKAAEAADAAEKQKKITQRMHALGYQPKMVNGTLLYCHKVPQLGSHFEKWECGTPEGYEKAAQASKDAVNEMRQKSLTLNPRGN
jgi:hypothetical protein